MKLRTLKTVDRAMRTMDRTLRVLFPNGQTVAVAAARSADEALAIVREDLTACGLPAEGLRIAPHWL
jgi:hypothetical protein